MLFLLQNTINIMFDVTARRKIGAQAQKISFVFPYSIDKSNWNWSLGCLFQCFHNCLTYQLRRLSYVVHRRTTKFMCQSRVCVCLVQWTWIDVQWMLWLPRIIIYYQIIILVLSACHTNNNSFEELGGLWFDWNCPLIPVPANKLSAQSNWIQCSIDQFGYRATDTIPN